MIEQLSYVQERMKQLMHYNCPKLIALAYLKFLKIPEHSNMAERRKSSILVNRKLSTDFHRKLSAISVASDVSFISERFGMEQGELKNIVADILEMNINDDFDVSE